MQGKLIIKNGALTSNGWKQKIEVRRGVHIVYWRCMSLVPC